MRLIRNERAYIRILDDFAAQRVSASMFVPRFRHLWHLDQAVGIDSVQPMSGARVNTAGLYGLLDSIDSLCGAYADNLPAGCGYRVSEEQFRKEIESMTSELRLPGAHEA